MTANELMGHRHTPYRIAVFATGTKGKGKRTKVVGYGYMGWTADQTVGAASRLPSAGSFCFAGLHVVRTAALEYLNLPHVHQVQVRTNQDRMVWLWNKHNDGRVTGYRPDNDRW